MQKKHKISLWRFLYMTIQAIYKKAVNNGYNAKTVQYNSGKYAVIIDGFKTIDFVNSIMQIYKRSNVHINFNVYTMTAYVMDIADYEADKAYNTAKTDLINIFWSAIHSGKNQQEAKASQYEYALKHNLIDIFNAIYA